MYVDGGVSNDIPICSFIDQYYEHGQDHIFTLVQLIHEACPGIDIIRENSRKSKQTKSKKLNNPPKYNFVDNTNNIRSHISIINKIGDIEKEIGQPKEYVPEAKVVVEEEEEETTNKNSFSIVNISQNLIYILEELISQEKCRNDVVFYSRLY
eukprot:Pgem_evm1s10477